MDSFTARIAALQAESASLRQYLRTLPPGAWSHPSACTEWQVRDVVAHLTGGAEFFADTVSRGLRGDTSPSAGRPPAGTITAAAAAPMLAQNAVALRERLGEQLLATFEAEDDHLNQLLAGLSPEARETPCYHVWRLFPAAYFINLRLQELALHGWDIRSSLAPEAHLSSESLPAMMDVLTGTLAAGFLRWTFRPGASLGAPVRYRFEVTGTVPHRADMVVDGEAARYDAVASTPAQVTLQCDTETYVLMMYGRLRLESALASGRVVATGGEPLAAAFGEWFKGI